MSLTQCWACPNLEGRLLEFACPCLVAKSPNLHNLKISRQTWPGLTRGTGK